MSVFLQGCVLFDFFRKKDEPTISLSKEVTLDKDALRQCSLLQEDLVVSTFDDALVVYGKLATQYGVCAKQQSNSVILLKKFGNIK